MADVKKVIEGEVVSALALSTELETLQSELMDNPKFARFLELRSAVNDKMTEVRSEIGKVMIPAYKAGRIDKTLKGDWGSITVKEDKVLDINEDKLTPRFWKKVPDTTKIRTIYDLEGKDIPGVDISKRYSIVIKLKSGGTNE